MRLRWDQVLGWRMRRHLLGRSHDGGPVQVARRLGGIQAQVTSAAELAVAVRQPTSRPGVVEQALDDRTLVRTWAMRGTLHLLAADEAAAYLSLLAAAKTWQKGAWQRTFATAEQLAAITEATCAALDGRVLTRDDLVAEVLERTGDETLSEPLRSGWGAVLKPLAWQGHLCNGPTRDGRVTFTRPDTWLAGWRGLPEPDAAARTVVRAYLGAHGPASMAAFDQWLTRGASKRAALRSWFGELGDELVTVDVEGQDLLARAVDVDDLAAATPSRDVRLLPGFDQYVLAPGTGDPQVVPPSRRQNVSKAAGWISPVVVAGGRVVGTWQLDGATVDVALFDEAGPVSHQALDAEAAHLGAFLGTSLTVHVHTG